MKKPIFSGTNSRIPMIRSGDGDGTRVIGHLNVNARLREIFEALVYEGFDGVAIEFTPETGTRWRIELSTPAGLFFEWVCHRATLGYPLPNPQRAVSFLHAFILTREE
ncbi:hypothetical protein [Burkholderia lata]|uniref:hypothetical protein n=1 Tax=Burkholderia lata (strain ATCC 17760 / DSM 23089 / LMG 22485 / NCIMB 9086 / R18194 / 383) TaxID=482957 RepID=UPI001453FA5C|nr:hypothetical protein [Burkholderia lata]VWB64700.1 hypothetical protein BLA15816_03053 [Burkholderia lata]